MSKDRFFHLSLLPKASYYEHTEFILSQIKTILSKEGMPEEKLAKIEFKPSDNLFILNKGEISKETLLDFTNTFNYTAVNQYSRFFVLFGIDLLNTAQVSSLLKFLEEPKTSTYGFLVSENPDAVLDTIRSRAFPVVYTKTTNSDKHVSLDAEILELTQEIFVNTDNVFENKVFNDNLKTPFLEFISVLNAKESKFAISLGKFFPLELDREIGKNFLRLVQTFIMDAINFKLKRTLHFLSQKNSVEKLASLPLSVLTKVFDLIQARVKAFFFPVNSRVQVLTAMVALDECIKWKRKLVLKIIFPLFT